VDNSVAADLVTALAALDEGLLNPSPSPSESDLDGLLDRILLWLRRLLGADAGSMYLRHGDMLRLVLVQNDTLGDRLGPAELRLRLQGLTLPLSPASIAGYVALTGDVVNVADVADAPVDAPWALCSALDRGVYTFRSALAVPIEVVSGEIIGVLQLFNALDEHRRPGAFPPGVEAVVFSFAVRAARIIARHRAEGLPLGLRVNGTQINGQG
jgi:GAF domain-containing protein